MLSPIFVTFAGTLSPKPKMYTYRAYIPYILLLSLLLPSAHAFAQKRTTALSAAFDSVRYEIELQGTLNNGQTPLWMASNRHGLSFVNGDYAYERGGVFHDTSADSLRKWRIGYGVDLALAQNAGQGVRFYVQQAYADFEYKKWRLSVGSKERPLEMKNTELSSGSQTFGTNARPIPQVRIELPEYTLISRKAPWIAVKGYFGYGIMTDGRWQKDYVADGGKYVKHTFYHSKALYLRLGNEERFPLSGEFGIETACEFGGTAYNVQGWSSQYSKIETGHGIKDFFKAIYGGGSDATDDGYSNAGGNTLGSWLFALKYQGRDWSIRAYYDHFFEDHSQMFLEYGWPDGLTGVEVQFPKNPVVSTLVYEYMRTDYQSGAVYHDATDALPDQVSGRDNYYNHTIYQGWQHWGQAIGNPLYTSPLYDDNGALGFTNNRFRAHHIGLSGDPAPTVHYRMLFSHARNLGTYFQQLSRIRYANHWLTEVTYAPRRIGRSTGWCFTAALAGDAFNTEGNNFGAQLSIHKTF